MAGHVDHGKTMLTKALTNVDTDRLKEEKERRISIEPGYALLPLGEYQTWIVDVPGHEKFIRQMIAGVAGIDLVILVIAADEGVMPQTKEHISILSFLGIKHGIIAISKVDKVEKDFLELIIEDIKESIKNTFFEYSDIVFVNSLTGNGLTKLKNKIKSILSMISPRQSEDGFRLPIDQVFTIHGYGTIVRGTIYEGIVSKGELVRLLPHDKPVQAKQLQVHNQERNEAVAGQRVAINIKGITKDVIKRGDVLVGYSNEIPTSYTIDVLLTTVEKMSCSLKQRAQIKFYSGTAEINGKIIFFDRNEVKSGEEVLCQIRLDKPVVVKRNDRYLIRRPSPIETIGGGWIINPLGAKYKFGEETIHRLEQMKIGDQEEQIIHIIKEQLIVTKYELLHLTGRSKESLEKSLDVLLKNSKLLELELDWYTLREIYQEAERQIFDQLRSFHKINPLRKGLNKAQFLHNKLSQKLIEKVIIYEVEKKLLIRDNQYIFLPDFKPYVPLQWKPTVDKVIDALRTDELHVKPFEEYLLAKRIPIELISDIHHYFLSSQIALPLDDKHIILNEVFDHTVRKLYTQTRGREFDIKEAKEVLDIKRKKLILFLELLDRKKITRRVGEKRKWVFKFNI